MSRSLRLAATWAALSLIFVLLFAATLPLALGDRSYTVRSGSMSPTIDAGDIVVVESISPLDARVGDIVAFQDPAGTGHLLNHRAQAIADQGDQVRFVTRGDANTALENWSVDAEGSIGRVAYRVPKLGFALVWTGTPAGRIGLVALPALALCFFGLRRIWSSGDDEVVADETVA